MKELGGCVGQVPQRILALNTSVSTALSRTSLPLQHSLTGTTAEHPKMGPNDRNDWTKPDPWDPGAMLAMTLLCFCHSSPELL